ncbi:MAG: hypothetical protein ABSE56_10120 [Bryobacteraceae bacterium]
MNISKDLQILRGEGCVFVPGPPANDLESATAQVSTWLEQNQTHPDVAEAQRWLDAAAPRIDRKRKERQVDLEVAAFRERLVESLRAQGDTWASWKVKHYHQKEVSEYEKKLRQKMGLE